MLTWNPARSAWETTAVMICGHSELFSETWPTSGSMRSGGAWKRPPLVPRTAGSECSSWRGLPTLPTPAAGSFNDSESVESFDARRERLRAKHNNGNGAGEPLTIAVKRL